LRFCAGSEPNPPVKLSIRVKPGSSRPGVGGSCDGALVVAVRAHAVDGQATDAALKVICDAVGCRRADIRLVSGRTSRTKIIELPDSCVPSVDRLLRTSG
jgi:uncharacterized protein YggU (UPF0235/DUF167 family)